MYKLGYHHTEEEKEKIRQGKLGAKNPNYGKKLSPETCAKMSASRMDKRHYRSPETIAKHRISLLKFYNTDKGDEFKQLLSELAIRNKPRKGHKHSIKSIEQMRNAKLGKKMSLDTKEKHSKSQTKLWQDANYKKMVSETHKELWNNPVYIANVINGMKNAQIQHPNGCELKIAKILEEIQPNVWKYVGDGSHPVGRKKPDFWNGGNKLIEHFGTYWHGERARCYEETEKGRIEFLEKHGYKVLIIWEHDLIKRPEYVKELIKTFINS
jgi:hypothetical protein